MAVCTMVSFSVTAMAAGETFIEKDIWYTMDQIPVPGTTVAGCPTATAFTGRPFSSLAVPETRNTRAVSPSLIAVKRNIECCVNMDTGTSLNLDFFSERDIKSVKLEHGAKRAVSPSLIAVTEQVAVSPSTVVGPA